MDVYIHVAIDYTMLIFKPGDRVGFHGWGEDSTKIVRGPLTIKERPSNPFDQHMWKFVEDALSVCESHLFHWKSDMKVGDEVPPDPMKAVLADIPRAREGMEARKVWDLLVNLPFLDGPGLKYFATHFPKTVDPERRTSRMLDVTVLHPISG